MKTYYKLAKPDGFDFYTGKTINYREGIGKTILCPNGDKTKGICSSGVIHASADINDAVKYAKLPFSAYIIQGKPVVADKDKCGFLKIEVISEIIDIDSACGWNYTEAINPINPLKIKPKKVTKNDIELLKKWASVRDSVRASVGASVGDSVGDSVRASVRASVGDSVWDSVGDSVGDSVWASVWDSVWAYLSSYFDLQEWKYVGHKKGENPYQPCIDLWNKGLVPSFDGKLWRLHGKEGKILWEGEVNADSK